MFMLQGGDSGGLWGGGEAMPQAEFFLGLEPLSRL